jgi:2-polyprenyl-3-methyl-5-hydroxy-6-metoxy-1,4-benzoquinol methylase
VTTARDYYDEYWSRDAPTPLDDAYAPGRLEVLQRELRAAGARRVLDAGCGAGGAVAALAADGFDVAGFDISARAVGLAPAGLELAVHPVEELPWPVEAESFDAVYAFEVIEHLLSPALLVRGAYSALREGGHLALSTPYHGRLKNLALVLLAWDKHFDPVGDHIRFFSDAALRRLLDAEGFETLRFHHLGRGPGLWADTVVWARKR